MVQESSSGPYYRSWAGVAEGKSYGPVELYAQRGDRYCDYWPVGGLAWDGEGSVEWAPADRSAEDFAAGAEYVAPDTRL